MLPTDPPNLSESIKALHGLCESICTEVKLRETRGESIGGPVQMTYYFAIWQGRQISLTSTDHSVRHDDLRFYRTCAHIAKIVLEHSPVVVLEGMTGMPPTEQIIIDLEDENDRLRARIIDLEMVRNP